MSSETIFANSDALVGSLLHLDDLMQKGANDGKILDVLKAQKKGLRNVLIADNEGLLKETINTYGHLFLWAPMYEYYETYKNPDFNPARFAEKYNKCHTESREQSRVVMGRTEGSGVGVGKAGERGEEGMAWSGEWSGEVVEGGVTIRDDRGTAEVRVGMGAGADKRSGIEIAGPAAVAVPIPNSDCPRPIQVMQVNTNPIKCNISGPEPHQALGLKK
ncbi:hypothetical protein CVT25_008429 [Psilocybe cyanescens]|uniref:Uncharacterized protein n=1 Tax=Psilocybe cyanescens TaxID=93625 RepID=A0A409WUV2_PSICY|nr:hypothetical protein CVT25_008429 [Psilocybe cyanescens]